MRVELYNQKLFSIVTSIFLLFIVTGCEKHENSAFGQKGEPIRSRMAVDDFFRMMADSNIQVVDQVREFLDAGISPNTTDSKGCTPLIYAIAAGKTNIASFLIERGANVEHVTSAGETPLRVACSSDDGTWAVRLLVANGANINGSTDAGMTPLMWVAQWGFEGTTDVLLELGADVSMTNRLGQTAAELAWMFGHQALAKKIIQPRTSVSTGTPPHTLTNPMTSE